MPRNLCKTVRNSIVNDYNKVHRYNSHSDWLKNRAFKSQKDGARIVSHLLIDFFEN